MALGYGNGFLIVTVSRFINVFPHITYLGLLNELLGLSTFVHIFL